MSFETFFEWLDSYELPIVRQQATVASRPSLRLAAATINHLSNGWLFVLLGIGLVIGDAYRIAATAVLSVLVAHLVYPMIKSYIARPRPVDRDPRLRSLVLPMDQYSFPSGHCMTATAVAIPIVFVMPGLSSLCVALWLLIAWARLAAAHHYPSDIVLGSLLGGIIAWPITSELLS